jgi:hypothetical protein
MYIEKITQRGNVRIVIYLIIIRKEAKKIEARHRILITTLLEKLFGSSIN